MKHVKKTLLYGQSGGPTAVINASAFGVICAAKKTKRYEKILCLKNGIEGLFNKTYFDVKLLKKSALKLLFSSPGCAFGSTRKRLSDDFSSPEYEVILSEFKRLNVRHFIYNGGNDSMDTCFKIKKYFELKNYDCIVSGLPKTIDNDLMMTHVSPGFMSSAKFINTVIQELVLDTSVYDKEVVTILEVMGRDTGWLGLSSTLLAETGFGPDLIFIPESFFSYDAFIQKIKETLMVKKTCFVVISEGIKFSDNTLVSSGLSNEKDAFGHTQLGGVCKILNEKVKTLLKVKSRGIELNLLQRASRSLASKTDLSLAFNLGKALIKLNKKADGKMITINDDFSFGLTDLEMVANKIKYVPSSFYDPNSCMITPIGKQYLKNLFKRELKGAFLSQITFLVK